MTIKEKVEEWRMYLNNLFGFMTSADKPYEDLILKVDKEIDSIRNKTIDDFVDTFSAKLQERFIPQEQMDKIREMIRECADSYKKLDRLKSYKETDDR